MLRLLEHYTSTQGEGPKVGTLTQFIRFAGCNCRCPGWPCDTEFAIDPKQWRTEYKKVTCSRVATNIHATATGTGARNICFTGGEPLLQPKNDLAAIMVEARGYEPGRYSFEFFTNGTIRIPQPLLERAAFVMDWKLPGSGEDMYNENRRINVTRLSEYPDNSVKFVVKDKEDFDHAQTIWRQYLTGADVEVFVGAVWNSPLSSADIVNLVKKAKMPWRLNVQVHNYIYGAQVRGT